MAVAAATAWKVAAATAVIGWLVTPVVAYFLPKVMSYLVVDPSEKIRDLKTRILPELEKTLHKVDVARMIRTADRARERASDLSALSDMAAWLRHAREDAEDIFDDDLEIKLYQSNCWQRLYGAAATCTSSCVRLLQWQGKILHRAGVSIRAISARLLLWARNRFKEPVPSGAASHAHAVDIVDSDIVELASVPAAVSEDAPSGLASHEQALVLVPTPSCSFLDVFQNRCRSIFYWLLDRYEKACFHRDSSYAGAGITSYQVRRQSHHPIPYAHVCPI
jgi:hypothetical protein